MTQEEKARVYDEALEKAREIKSKILHSWEMLGEDEKPVPNDLEEAADDAAHDFEKGPGCEDYTADLKYMFKAGAKCQKELMLKNAVETEVVSRVTNKGLLPAVTFLVDKSYKEGDKVKVLIVK